MAHETTNDPAAQDEQVERVWEVERLSDTQKPDDIVNLAHLKLANESYSGFRVFMDPAEAQRLVHFLNAVRPRLAHAESTLLEEAVDLLREWTTPVNWEDGSAEVEGRLIEGNIQLVEASRAFVARAAQKGEPADG